jgi:hypothetical protein
MRLVIFAFLFAASLCAQRLTNDCLFLAGPARGSVHNFAGYPPIRIGSPCNDGNGSVGVAVDGRGAGRFSLSGDDGVCSDVIGTSVPYESSNSIPKSGLATVIGDRPVIYLRPTDLLRFSPPVRRFLLAHECGHHALGQVLAALYYNAPIARDDELSADCFAGQQLKRIGRLTETEWRDVLDFLRTVPGDPTTYPGPQRVSKLLQCVR